MGRVYKAVMDEISDSKKKQQKLNEGTDEDFIAAKFRAHSVVDSFLKKYPPTMVALAFEDALKDIE